MIILLECINQLYARLITKPYNEHYSEKHPIFIENVLWILTTGKKAYFLDLKSSSLWSYYKGGKLLIRI